MFRSALPYALPFVGRYRLVLGLALTIRISFADRDYVAECDGNRDGLMHAVDDGDGIQHADFVANHDADAV